MQDAVWQERNRVFRVRCHDCDAINHWAGWELKPMADSAGATPATCWHCDARQVNPSLLALVDSPDDTVAERSLTP